MKTWSDKITVAADPGLNLCEATILECHDGTLVAFMRENSVLGLDCYKTISTDGGETWSEIYQANLPGCHRPVSGFLNDGSVMISYRFYPCGLKPCGVQNTFLALTDEESVKCTDRTQQKFRIAPLDYDRSPTGDTGYTGFVTFPDGEIYMVNYILDDAPKAQIRGYSFKIDMLLVHQNAQDDNKK
jgi:sialidase-1